MDMFAGTGGSGVKDVPSSHSQAMVKKCVTCHMHTSKEQEEEKDDALPKGGHTFLIDDRVCLECHKDPKSLAEKWQSDIGSILKKLKSLLDNTSDKTSKSYKTARLNYNLVMADGGIGLHNPRYAQALLKYSIYSMTAESAWKK